MSSSRLPGKVLMPLAGEPALVRLMERLRNVQLAQDPVIATSWDPSDDELVSLCMERGFNYVRGPLLDVLERFCLAADKADLDVVVRVTGDCPLSDPRIIDRCINEFLSNRHDMDYLANSPGGGYPDGLDVEVFSFEALQKACRASTSPEDREHVTPYIIRMFRNGKLEQAVDLSRLRLTVDYPEDYETVAAIFDELYSDQVVFTCTDVYRLLIRRPSLIRVASPTLDEQERRRLIELLARQVAIDEKRAGRDS
jgi:spore coat polysaccharide biosynthesis protein SpsF